MNESEKETYLIASKLYSFNKKIEDSMKIIKEAMDKNGDWVISFSGGKDSTVLADLLYKCGWNGIGIFFWYSEYENPCENWEQAEWAMKKYGFDIKKEKSYGSYDAWKETGHFFTFPKSKFEIECSRKCVTDFKNVSKSFMKHNGCKNIFMGITKEESRARKINLNMRGEIYKTNDRCGFTCCPLSNWSGTDIWAYIVSNNLKYLSVYDLPYWKRERIRNELTVIYCSDLVLRGELTQYRIAYPKLFSKLQNEFPEVRQYV